MQDVIDSFSAFQKPYWDADSRGLCRCKFIMLCLEDTGLASCRAGGCYQFGTSVSVLSLPM